MTDIVQVKLSEHLVETIMKLQTELGADKMDDVMTDIFTIYNDLKQLGAQYGKEPADMLEVLEKSFARFVAVASRGNALCEAVLSPDNKLVKLEMESHMPKVLESVQAAALRRKGLSVVTGNLTDDAATP